MFHHVSSCFIYFKIMLIYFPYFPNFPPRSPAIKHGNSPGIVWWPSSQPPSRIFPGARRRDWANDPIQSIHIYPYLSVSFSFFIYLYIFQLFPINPCYPYLWVSWYFPSKKRSTHHLDTPNFSSTDTRDPAIFGSSRPGPAGSSSSSATRGTATESTSLGARDSLRSWTWPA